MSILKIYFPNYYLNNVKKNREKNPHSYYVQTYVFKAICKSMSIKFLYRIYKRMRIKKISYTKKMGKARRNISLSIPFTWNSLQKLSKEVCLLPKRCCCHSSFQIVIRVRANETNSAFKQAERTSFAVFSLLYIEIENVV